MKSDQTIIRKVSYGTDLIGLEDRNIKVSFVLKHQTHIEIRAKLDYLPRECQNCGGKQIKYDFQRYSTIPILDIQGFSTVLKLKKRRFQCKFCRKVTVSESTLVDKNCQIPRKILAKITQYHTENLTNTAIARSLHVSVSVVQRQLEKFNFKNDYKQLPQVMSWDEFSQMKLPYSNAKLEATNKMIKDIKRQAFGFRNFKNFKTKIFLAFNIKRERTKRFFLEFEYKSPTTVDKEPK